MTLVSLSVPLCLSFSPLRHISFHHFSTFFLLSTLCFLALCFFIPCCSPSLSSLVFLSVLLVRLYLQHVRGGHFKSPMKCTLCVTFMTHTLLYLFFHFLPFFSSVVNTYIVVSLCGAPPLLLAPPLLHRFLLLILYCLLSLTSLSSFSKPCSLSYTKSCFYDRKTFVFFSLYKQ